MLWSLHTMKRFRWLSVWSLWSGSMLFKQVWQSSHFILSLSQLTLHHWAFLVTAPLHLRLLPFLRIFVPTFARRIWRAAQFMFFPLPFLYPLLHFPNISPARIRDWTNSFYLNYPPPLRVSLVLSDPRSSNSEGDPPRRFLCLSFAFVFCGPEFRPPNLVIGPLQLLSFNLSLLVPFLPPTFNHQLCWAGHFIVVMLSFRCVC